MSFKKLINDLTDEERKEFDDIRLNFLIEFTEIIKKHNGHPFLDCGTLLGAVREKDFIVWDNDMDVGIKHEELNQDMIDELNQKYLIRMHHPYLEDLFFASYLLKKDEKPVTFKGHKIWIDLMVYYPFSNGLRAVSNDTPEYLTTKLFMLPGFAISKFKTLNFLGHDFYIPENEESWLESWYTKNWRIPKAKSRCKNYIKRSEDFTYNFNDYKNFNENKKLF